MYKGTASGGQLSHVGAEVGEEPAWDVNVDDARGKVCGLWCNSSVGIHLAPLCLSCSSL